MDLYFQKLLSRLLVVTTTAFLLGALPVLELGARPLSLTLRTDSPPDAAASDVSEPSAALPSDAGNAADASLDTSPNYRLRAFDYIRMTMTYENNMVTLSRLDQDGRIIVPFLGTVEVAGMSIFEVETELERRYFEGDFFQKPDVSIDVIQYADRRVKVLGSITSPGLYNFPHEKDMTLSSVVSRAGGVGPVGDPRKISLIRTLPSGGRVTTRYDLRDIVQRGKEDPVLMSGDIIFVPEDPFLVHYGGATGER
ncbi:MAG: polysaccharide biosynthesis/export family protein [Opitutales bacterium]